MVKTKIHSHKRKVHPRPRHHEVPFFNSEVTNIVVGAAAGCIVGAAAALFLAPKPQKNKIAQGFDQIYGCAHDAIEKGTQVFNGAKNTAENLYESAAEVFSENSTSRNLILGLLGAGVLGASAIYMMNQKPAHESFASRWGTSKWSEMGKMMIDAVSHKLHDDEDNHHHHHGEGENPVSNVFNWAMAGLNLWNEIKKGR